MTATPEGAPPAPRSYYQVTHFVRAGGEGSSWSQSQSGHLSSADAQEWIDHQAIEAADLGFADGPEGQLPDPTPPAGAVTSAATPAAAARTKDTAPQLGDS